MHALTPTRNSTHAPALVAAAAAALSASASISSTGFQGLSRPRSSSGTGNVQIAVPPLLQPKSSMLDLLCHARELAGAGRLRLDTCVAEGWRGR